MITFVGNLCHSSAAVRVRICLDPILSPATRGVVTNVTNVTVVASGQTEEAGVCEVEAVRGRDHAELRTVEAEQGEETVISAAWNEVIRI